MGDRLYVGTRKGLFELAPGRNGWDVSEVSFLGDPVTAVREWGARINHVQNDGAEWAGVPGSC